MFKIALRLAILFTICLLVACVKPIPEDTQNYLLAFAERGSSRIRARISGDGISWESAGFQDVKTDIGVGAGIEDSGFVKIIPWVTNANKLEFVWGLAHAFAQSDSVPTNQVATSSPSVVALPNSATWLTSFRTTANKVTLRVFEPEGQQGLLAAEVLPANTMYNDNVVGRPAITRLGSKIVLAWLRQVNSGPREIRMAVGNLIVSNNDLPTLSWTHQFAFGLPDTFSDICYHPNAISEPTLTNDQADIYLAFTRQTWRCPGNLDGSAFTRETLFLYSSPDGANWTPEDPLATKKVGLGSSFVNIAGRSDKSILVAMIGYDGPAALKFQNGSWTELDADAIFGNEPAQRQFALVSGGHPAIEVEREPPPEEGPIEEVQSEDPVPISDRGWQYETSFPVSPIIGPGYRDGQGDFVIAGDTVEYDHRYWTWVLRADETGVPKWHKSFIGFDPHGIDYLLRAPGGNTILLGYEELEVVGEPNNAALRVVKLSSMGDVLSSIGLIDQWSGGLDGHPMTDGGIVLASTVSPPQQAQRLWISKLDAENNIELNKTYTLDPNTNFFEINIVQTADEGYVLSGGISEGFGFDQGKVFVIRLDADGNIIWQKLYGGGPATHQDGASRVIEMSDGRIAVVGFTESFGPNAGPQPVKYYFLVIMLDANGDVEWSQAIGNPSEYPVASWARFVEELENGNLLVSGLHFPGYKKLAVELDGSGSIVWSRVYMVGSPPAGESAAVGDIQIHPMDGDEFVLFGPSCSRAAPIAVAMADDQGNLETGCFETEDQVPGIFSYPAPVTATDLNLATQDGNATVMPVELSVRTENATQVACRC